MEDSNNNGRWRRGKISRRNPDGSFNIKYAQGYLELSVAASRVRFVNASTSQFLCLCKENMTKEEELRRRVLAGDFLCDPTTCRNWKAPTFKLLVFVSSTFTDTQRERDYLMDQLLYELREKARGDGIQVVFADLRTGIRDESSCEHETWLECSRVLNWCKQESMGLFFLSLQGDKYGYTPLPKVLSQKKLDEHLAATNCPEETRKLVYEWYLLDENAVGEKKVVLRNLEAAQDPFFWSAFDRMLKAISGVDFDEERYEGLQVGCSVTEWEVRAALDDLHFAREWDLVGIDSNDVGLQEVQANSNVNPYASTSSGVSVARCEGSFIEDRLNLACWSHRHVCGDVSVKEYCDVTGNEVKEKLAKLKQFMREKIPPHGIQTWELKSESDLLSRESESYEAYFDDFKKFVKMNTFASLEAIVEKKARWMEDGAGIGLRGELVTEMLHHSAWAFEKCRSFIDIEELTEKCVTMISPPQRFSLSQPKRKTSLQYGGICGSLLQCVQSLIATKREIFEFEPSQRSLRIEGICCYVVGPSGSGKTALMAKTASEVYRRMLSTFNALVVASDFHPPPPVLIRFCGTSPGSRSARHLMVSLCCQMELLFGLPRLAVSLSDKRYEELVTYFQSLLHCHAVILFVDSLDQLSDEDLGRSQISFLKGVQPHVDTRIIVSCLPDEAENLDGRKRYLYLCETRLKEAGVPRMDVKTYGAETMLLGLLERQGRTMSLDQLSVVRERLAEGEEKTALYVNLAVRVIAKWTSQVDARTELLGGTRQLIEQLFRSLEHQYGKLLVRRALALMTFSSRGISVEEMEDLLSLDNQVLDFVFQYFQPLVIRLPSHVWLRLFDALDGLIVEGDQRCLSWYHKQLREVAEDWFDREESHLAHRLMAKYFGNLTNSEVVVERRMTRQNWTICGRSVFDGSSKVNVRRCVEAAYHMLRCGMLSECSDELCDLEGALSKLRAGEGYQLVGDLIRLERVLKCGTLGDESACELERSTRVNHFLRWLRGDMSYLVSNPLKRFLISATRQPECSVVNSSAWKLWKSIQSRDWKITTSLQCAQTLGVGSNFDALLSTIFVNETINSISFSPDGVLLASGSNDRTIKLWETATGLLKAALKGHSRNVNSVCFSPDGLSLASGSYDNTVKLWETATGSVRATLEGHFFTVISVCFSPDGVLLASGSLDKTIKLWRTATGELVTTLEGHSGCVSSVSFSPDGVLLASGSQDTTIKLWETATGSVQATLKGHSHMVSSVSFSPDGVFLASGSWDNTIKLWDTATGSVKSTLESHSDDVVSVCFSPDGVLLASGSRDKTIKLWEIATASVKATLEGHSKNVIMVCFSPDGTLLASGSEDKTIKLWETAAGPGKAALGGHARNVNSVCFSPDGLLLASGSHDKTIKLWETAVGSLKATLEGHSSAVISVRFSPDGVLLASGSHDKTIKLWETATGLLTATLRGHSNAVISVCFNPDGVMLASGSRDNTVKLWETTTGSVNVTLNSFVVNSVYFSPDGVLLAIGSRDQTIKLWETATGSVKAALEGHSDRVTSVCFSPDGALLASGSEDKTIKLWETAVGPSEGNARRSFKRRCLSLF